MLKTLGKFTLAAFLAAAMVGVPMRVSADDATNAPAKPHRGTRFFGKIAAVDSTAKTITVDNKSEKGRVFQITSDTKIMKDGKPATLGDATVGDDVGGSYSVVDGKNVAKNVRIGKAPKKPAASSN